MLFQDLTKIITQCSWLIISSILHIPQYALRPGQIHRGEKKQEHFIKEVEFGKCWDPCFILKKTLWF